MNLYLEHKEKILLEQFYKDVKTFNTLAGNKHSMQGFIAQQKCLVEECSEIDDGITNNDVVEILDGVIDVIYVALGHLQKLEELGCDVEGAIKKVCDDNLSKFPISVDDAEKSVRFYNEKDVNVSWEHNKEFNRYVIKDEAKKVRKPWNFVPTNLEQYVPEELKKKGLK